MYMDNENSGSDEWGTGEIIAGLFSDIDNRVKPSRIEVAPEGSQLSKVPIAPGEITVVGGGSGDGKSVLLNQLAFNAMFLQKKLRVLIANVEMSPPAMLEREISRLSGVDHTSIRKRTYQDDAKSRLTSAFRAIGSLSPRLAFMKPPFKLDSLREHVDKFQPGLIVVDYLQRFDVGAHRNERAQIAAVISACRDIALTGPAILGASALNRQSSGKKASMGSLRDSSELEYGADLVYQLTYPYRNTTDATLNALKNRHGKRENIYLTFEQNLQRFVDRVPQAAHSVEGDDND
jgi:replicative DNA helicase